MKKHLHNSLRALFLSIAVLLSLPMLAVEVEIDGINYDLNAEAKQATVIRKSSGEYSGEVVIPESVEHESTAYSVESIGSYAFCEYSGLTSVTIPNSVTSIGNEAFWCCSGLTSVTIGNSVVSIGDAAFCFCDGLTSVTIPNSVTSIGYSAFALCSGLTSVTIGNGVTSIGNQAFNGCSGLTSVTIPNSVTSIGYAVFFNCSGLTSVTIPNSVTSIGERAFLNCSGLTSVTIPNNVTSIGQMAFANCSKLLDVYCYAENVPSTESNAFESSSIGNATLHVPAGSVDSYKTAPWNDFGTIVALPPFSGEVEIDGINYELNGETMQAAVIKKSSGEYSGKVVIPESVEHEGTAYSVKSIGEVAFANCSGLTSVTIPNSVTSIGDDAFSCCDGLTSVTIGNSVTSIGNYAFYGSSKLLDVYCYAENVPSTGSYVFFKTLIQSGTLHVPAGSIDSYRAHSTWSMFRTITPILNIALSDGADFENDVEQSVTTLTYTRTLPNLLWNSLYVPFEIPYSEISDKYDVAYINTMHSYDTDDDGEIDDLTMEAVKIKSGTLMANYPYLIKAKTEDDKDMVIELENTTLFPSEENSIDCSSVFKEFKVTGSYSKKTAEELEGSLAISTTGVWQPLAEGTSLNPFRLYLTISEREGSPVKVDEAALSRIRINVFGEDDATGIHETENGTEGQRPEGLKSKVKTENYDLSGRRVNSPAKGGIYIVNGKKIVK